jgi:hypothetical protein
MEVRSKIRTPEQRTKKMLNEERTILNLHLAIKKEVFKNNLKIKPAFPESYIKVTDITPQDCVLVDHYT